MKLFDDLATIVQQIESILDIRLSDEHFADGREEIIHVFLHEACHAAIARCVPWIYDLSEHEHTVLDEILARLLEGEIGTRLGLQIHSPEEHVRELAMYSVKINVEQYTHLQAEWRQHYWSAKDMAGMATYGLNYLRSVGVTNPSATV